MKITKRTALPAPKSVQAHKQAAVERAHRRAETTRAEASVIADPLLRLPAVKLVTGFSTSSLYSFMAQGKFPEPIALGGARLWPKSEIEAWIAQVKASSPRGRFGGLSRGR
jgi:prophage regulatory protein